MVSSTIGAGEEAAENGVVVWARGNAQDHQRANALIAAMAQDPALAGVPAQAEMYHIGAGSYESLWQIAEENGRPPDIVALDMGDLPEWAAQGRLEPLDDCLNQYDEFADARPELWPAVTWQGQRWGVPQELGLHLFFFNKAKLRQLGWSETEIASLPQRIQSGQFSLADMAETARQAVAQGVADPGFGYWRRPGTISESVLNHYAAFGGQFTDPDDPGKLVINRNALEQTYAFARQLRQNNVAPANAASAPWNRAMSQSIWHDAVSHGQVLFWDAPIWYWARWDEYYSGAAFLEENVGYALQPGGTTGQPGFAWATARFYALSASRTAAEKARACHILARATTPEINLAHVTDNMYLSVLQPESYGAGAAADRYEEKDILRFGETAVSRAQLLPNQPQFGRYANILLEYLLLAEDGRMTPEEAAAAAISKLEAELGKELTIGE